MAVTAFHQQARLQQLRLWRQRPQRLQGVQAGQAGGKLAGAQPHLRQLQPDHWIIRGVFLRAQKSQFGVPQALLRHQNPAQLAQAVQPVGRQLQGGVDGVFGFAQALLPVAHLRQRAPGFGLRGRLRHCPLGMAAGLGQVAQRGVHKSCLDMGVGVVRRAGLKLMHHGQRQRGIVLFQRQPGQHAHGFGVARVVPQGAL